MPAPKKNQYAAKPASSKVSGVGRVVIDLGPLKARVVAEANRRGKGHSLKSVIVDALERMLGRTMRYPTETGSASPILAQPTINSKTKQQGGSPLG